jgi:hypothetical protein
VLWWALVAPAAVLWTAIAVAFAWMNRGLPRLRDASPPAGPPPAVSVVVASRDEEREVEAATRSLLRQEGVDLEVVAVDDRSADATGAILDRLAAEDPRLRVVHLDHLPDGWLGKTHACHRGAAEARGDWLLFTDGDVHLERGALWRAVGFAKAHGLGHVVAIPRLLAGGFWERAFITCFAVMVSLKMRPWELRRPGTGAYVGAGAFNLVRRTDYLAVGGHHTLALEVVDDVKLGLILRRSGVAQAAVDSGGLVSVRWQQGFLASCRGLVKNSFAAVEWRWGMTLGGAVMMALLAVVPLAGVVGGPAEVRGLAGLPLVVSMLLHGGAARRLSSGTGLEGLTFPVCGTALLAVTLWSALSATVRGVSWRGRHYPLAALRQGCVREADWPASRAVGWN